MIPATPNSSVIPPCPPPSSLSPGLPLQPSPSSPPTSSLLEAPAPPTQLVPPSLLPPRAAHLRRHPASPPTPPAPPAADASLPTPHVQSTASSWPLLTSVSLSPTPPLHSHGPHTATHSPSHPRPQDEAPGSPDPHHPFNRHTESFLFLPFGLDLLPLLFTTPKTA